MKKITRQDDLAGKTIRCCMDGFGGIQVLVFEDNDWCVFEAEYGNDDTCVLLEMRSVDLYDDIKHYLPPIDLLEADLLSRPQYDMLVAEQTAQEAARKRAQAQRLLDDAAALEINTQAEEAQE